jgi:hypothetical protein
MKLHRETDQSRRVRKLMASMREPRPEDLRGLEASESEDQPFLTAHPRPMSPQALVNSVMAAIGQSPCSTIKKQRKD